MGGEVIRNIYNPLHAGQGARCSVYIFKRVLSNRPFRLIPTLQVRRLGLRKVKQLSHSPELIGGTAKIQRRPF